MKVPKRGEGGGRRCQLECDPVECCRVVFCFENKSVWAQTASSHNIRRDGARTCDMKIDDGTKTGVPVRRFVGNEGSGEARKTT